MYSSGHSAMGWNGFKMERVQKRLEELRSKERLDKLGLFSLE